MYTFYSDHSKKKGWPQHKMYNIDRNVSSLRFILCTTILYHCFLKKIHLARIFKKFRLINLSVKELSMGVYSFLKNLKQGLSGITANPGV